MKCRDCENLIWGYAEGERIWQCRERYCPDLDIERDCPDFAPQKPDIFTAFSTLQADNERLRAELEQVKQERDAAAADIMAIAKGGKTWMCPYCGHAKDTTSSMADCELDIGVCMMPYSKFEWRGPQKED